MVEKEMHDDAKQGDPCNVEKTPSVRCGGELRCEVSMTRRLRAAASEGKEEGGWGVCGGTATTVHNNAEFDRDREGQGGAPADAEGVSVENIAAVEKEKEKMEVEVSEEKLREEKKVEAEELGASMESPAVEEREAKQEAEEEEETGADKCLLGCPGGDQAQFDHMSCEAANAFAKTIVGAVEHEHDSDSDSDSSENRNRNRNRNSNSNHECMASCSAGTVMGLTAMAKGFNTCPSLLSGKALGASLGDDTSDLALPNFEQKKKVEVLEEEVKEEEQQHKEEVKEAEQKELVDADKTEANDSQEQLTHDKAEARLGIAAFEAHEKQAASEKALAETKLQEAKEEGRGGSGGSGGFEQKEALEQAAEAELKEAGHKEAAAKEAEEALVQQLATDTAQTGEAVAEEKKDVAVLAKMKAEASVRGVGGGDVVGTLAEKQELVREAEHTEGVAAGEESEMKGKALAAKEEEVAERDEAHEDEVKVGEDKEEVAEAEEKEEKEKIEERIEERKKSASSIHTSEAAAEALAGEKRSESESGSEETGGGKFSLLGPAAITEEEDEGESYNAETHLRNRLLV